MATPRLTFLSGFAAALAGAAGAAVGWNAWQMLPIADPVLRGGAATLAGSLALLALWTPVVLVAQSQFRRLCQRVNTCASEGRPDAAPAPIWLRPVARAMNRPIELWAERATKLQSSMRETQIQLRVAEAERQHIETILHSLRDAVIVTNAFDELTMANAAAARLLGFDTANATDRSIDDLISDPELRQMIRDARSSGVANKQRHVEHELTGSAADRKDARSFDIALVCLPDPSGGCAGVVTILRDITRDKEISQMKSDFVSQASHELRTPLSSINAYVEMLIDGETQDEATRQEFYQIIKSEADRVSRMVDNMLNISRIEAGIQTAEYSDVDFVEVAEHVVETMAPQAKLKDITLSCRYGPLVYTAEADRDLVHQVIMNLVSNAIKYTPEGGRVTVSIENDDASRSILVTVADTGLGIPPEVKSRVFEKFFRVENYKRVAKGTGLGLNLVKHIVETVHKGQVGLESEVGMGSKFFFTIPYTQDDMASRLGAAA
ncbi:MAG: PAS domain-containing protein [Phycisphaerales bacterium]|nr:PAS domain-containing protein [Phycisphaerales bacterium]